MTLPDQLKSYATSHELIRYGDTLVIGLSGGADSVALLVALHALRDEWGLHLHGAHFNHHLRPCADQDQELIEALCTRFNCPLSIGHWQQEARKEGSRSEADARDARFNFFKDVLKTTKANAVALAHTQNDCAETVLMRLIRGTGLQGLRGILPRRHLKDFQLTIIRPLLSSSRIDIESYLRANNIHYTQDPTNNDPKFLRNKIRHDLLPHLKNTYNANIMELLSNTSLNLTKDYDYIRQQAQTLLPSTLTSDKGLQLVMPLQEFLNQHPALQHHLTRLIWETLKGDTRQLTMTHMTEIIDLAHHRPVNAQVHLPDHISVEKTENQLVFLKQTF